VTPVLQLLFLVGLLAVMSAAVWLPTWAGALLFVCYVAGAGILGLILGGRDEDPNLE
jgi:hypothetical protein